ncbi:PAS domain-containing protein [Candidatus Saccharibacteria bacterium]|nr:PAS domain-containing protein [Candidatus Saccharibacteria bacterium]MCB9817005.1 PAS domain-containing protein [Candidatus Nomurabacteria bacterium]HPD98728.1 ATP-binding protein [Candidatus Saccharibacteria bacterium]
MLGFNKKQTPQSNQAPTLAKNLFDEKAKSDIILNAIDDGVILIDANKTIQLFNPAAEKITGWAQKDALNIQYTSVLKLIDKKNEPYTQEMDPFYRIFTEIATIKDNQANILSSGGKLIALDITVTPLINQQNQITGAVGVFRDVTEQRSAEAQRAEFISTASHEMRTPVAAIEGYLALAMNERVSKIDSKARDYLEKAHTSTQHLGKLFQDLLTSAKAEDGRLQNHPVVTEMGEYLEQLTQDLRFSAEKKGLGMEYLIGAVGQATSGNRGEAGGKKVVRPLYYAHIDPDRMREVITNLFDNATKYTDSGKVSVGITGDDHVVQIRIQDTGAGIPKEDVPHLFEKFYRVDNTATRTIGGTGLGLFICRKIVEMYNGRVWVESTLGQGSIFYINLPRLTTEKAQALQIQETAAASGTAGQPQVTQPTL